MTTPSTPRKAGPLLGNNAQYLWPFAFKVFDEDDIKVTIADSDGVETELGLDTDYTVALNANQETSPGGTVTYPIVGAELPTGSVLVIVGDVAYDQPLDLPGGGNFAPLALENQLDRSTMQIQQLREEMDRTAKLPVTRAEDADALVADIVRLADSADNLDTLADNIASVLVVAADLSEPVSEINTVATAIANVDVVGTNIANVNIVAGIAANITTVAGIAAEVTAMAGIAAEVTAVAGIDTEVTTVAGIAADVQTVADNVADVTNFADVYQGPKAADPVLRNDGSALQAGDLYFNTTENALRAYSGAVWVAGTAGTVGVTQFSGDGVTFAFVLPTAPASENNTWVFIGGTYQQKDQYSLGGATITFAEAPPAGTDNIEVVSIATLAIGVTDAALVVNAPSGNIVATTVQNAINELDTKKQAAMVVASQAEMEDGTEAEIRSMSPLRVAQAIGTLRQVQPIGASVGANALTLSAAALSLDFRSAALGSGTVTQVKGTPAPLVISSGSTLGTTSGVKSRLAVLAINNAGAIELAVVNASGGINLDESGLISTTAEGGAGTADSASTIYSATARASVPFRVLGFVESTQVTSGTWATAPSTIQGAGGGVEVVSRIRSGTSVTTSGTTIDLTGIPSWVKRITVMFDGVSTNGTSNPLLQLGDSGGPETTGYAGTSATSSAGGVTTTAFSAGFTVGGLHTAATILQGAVTLSLMSSTTNTWVISGGPGRSDAQAIITCGGAKSLSGTLDRIRLTTVNGVDAFDAGSVNILYE